MKKHIVAGNWKLYIETSDQAKKLAAGLKRKMSAYPGVDVLLFPPSPFIASVASTVKGSAIEVGAQASSAFEGGAYTGYISAPALKSAGATWVLVGHSERRALEIDGMQGAGETETTVHREIQAAQAAGLGVVLCVGEKERDPGGAHFSVVTSQLSSALKGVSKTQKLIVAYEPVWAIGKTAAEAMKPSELEEMVIFIKKTLTDVLDRTAALKIPILYGGSVDSSNASNLIAEGGVSGFLVGRASTDAGSFGEILNACKK